MKTIGFIGLGNMGYAIYKGMPNGYSCLAYDPHPRKDTNIHYTKDFQELLDRSDMLILCVKPAQIPSVLELIQKPVDLVSIAAGVSYGFLKDRLPKSSRLVRTMPNLPLLVGEGCLGYFGDKELYKDIQEIFSPMGMVLELPKEDLMDAVTGLSGSGPAFVFSFIHAMAEGGVKSGLSYQDSLDLSVQTIQGTVSYLFAEKKENPSLHPMELRNRVTSAGGTTIYGLSEWEKNSVSYGIMESVFQACKRSQEMG